MLKRTRLAVLSLALGGLFAGQGGAQAQLLPLTLLDMMIKTSNKEALAVPGHAAWCAQSRPGYRAQWNNWRTPEGRVTYCASPYYSPPWQVPYASR